MYVVAVDRRSMEDLLLWQGVGRVLARSRPGAGLIVVHAPGETAERILEGEGLDLRGPDGLLRAGTPGGAALLERAVRSEMRRIVGLLTESGVPAVGFAGGDRGLFSDGGSGRWLKAVAAAGPVPIVASAVVGEGAGHELSLAASTHWMVARLGVLPVFLAAEGAGSATESPEEGRLPARDPDAVAELESRGIRALITAVSDLGTLGAGPLRA